MQPYIESVSAIYRVSGVTLAHVRVRPVEGLMIKFQLQYVESVAAIYRQLQPYIESVAATYRVICSHILSL